MAPELPTYKSKRDKFALMFWIPFAATFGYLGFFLITTILTLLSSTGEASFGSLGFLILFVAPVMAFAVVLGLIVFFYWPKREAWHPYYLFPAAIFWSVIGLFSFSGFLTATIAVELRDETGSPLQNFSVQYRISIRQDSISAMMLYPLVGNLIDSYSGTKSTGRDGVLRLRTLAFECVTLSTESTDVVLEKNSQGYTVWRTWNLRFPGSGFPIVQELADPLRVVGPRRVVVMLQTNVDDQGGLYVSDTVQIVDKIVAGKYTDSRMAPVLRSIVALNWIDEIVEGSRSNPVLLRTLSGIASMCQTFAQRLHLRNLELTFEHYRLKMDPDAGEPMSEKDYDDFLADLKLIRQECMSRLK